MYYKWNQTIKRLFLHIHYFPVRCDVLHTVSTCILYISYTACSRWNGSCVCSSVSHCLKVSFSFIEEGLTNNIYLKCFRNFLIEEKPSIPKKNKKINSVMIRLNHLLFQHRAVPNTSTLWLSWNLPTSRHTRTNRRRHGTPPSRCSWPVCWTVWRSAQSSSGWRWCCTVRRSMTSWRSRWTESSRSTP